MTSLRTLALLAAAAGALALAACETDSYVAASAPPSDNSGGNAATADRSIETNNPDASDPGGTRASKTGSGLDVGTTH